jgi:hypothetical protein
MASKLTISLGELFTPGNSAELLKSGYARHALGHISE